MDALDMCETILTVLNRDLQAAYDELLDLRGAQGPVDGPADPAPLSRAEGKYFGIQQSMRIVMGLKDQLDERT
tara:strand:- start:379 stop:597 length:219 start_codon:yes stop_codon:yes gene_type:complete